eukprot:3935366-Rhodomonas_salina.3
MSFSGEDGVELKGMYQQPSQRIPPTLSCGGATCAPMTDMAAGSGRVEVDLALHVTQSVCAWTFSKFVGNFVVLSFTSWDLEPVVHYLEVCEHNEKERLINYYRQGSFKCEIYNATKPPPQQLALSTPSWVEFHTLALTSDDVGSARQWLPSDRFSSQRNQLVFEHRSFASSSSIPASVATSRPLPVRYAPGVWPEVKGEEEGLLLGVTNTAAEGAKPPCSFVEGWTLPHSIFKLKPRREVPVLEGSWNGECLTVGNGERESNRCVVDMKVEKGVLAVWISGCDDVTGAGLTTGVLEPKGETEKMWLSVEKGVVWRQRYDVHFTSGDERRTKFGPMTVGKATVIWDDNGDEIPEYAGGSISLGILRPGESNAAGTDYPADFPDTMEFGTYDCGVMNLEPVTEDQLTLALPGQSRSTPFLKAALAVELFKQCNASVWAAKRNMSDAGSDCNGFSSLFDSRRWPSTAEVSTWENLCLSKCYGKFRARLAEAVQVCTTTWHQFAESPWVDIWASVSQETIRSKEVHRVKNFFAARVMTVLDLDLRMDLACQVR